MGNKYWLKAASLLGVNGDVIHSAFGGNNAKSLRTNVNASLKKLQTEYIDALYLHWWDFTTSIPEIMLDRYSTNPFINPLMMSLIYLLTKLLSPFLLVLARLCSIIYLFSLCGRVPERNLSRTWVHGNSKIANPPTAHGGGKPRQAAIQAFRSARGISVS